MLGGVAQPEVMARVGLAQRGGERADPPRPGRRARGATPTSAPRSRNTPALRPRKRYPTQGSRGKTVSLRRLKRPGQGTGDFRRRAARARRDASPHAQGHQAEHPRRPREQEREGQRDQQREPDAVEDVDPEDAGAGSTRKLNHSALTRVAASNTRPIRSSAARVRSASGRGAVRTWTSPSAEARGEEEGRGHQAVHPAQPAKGVGAAQRDPGGDRGCGTGSWPGRPVHAASRRPRGDLGGLRCAH